MHFKAYLNRPWPRKCIVWLIQIIWKLSHEFAHILKQNWKVQFKEKQSKGIATTTATAVIFCSQWFYYSISDRVLLCQLENSSQNYTFIIIITCIGRLSYDMNIKYIQLFKH